MRENARGGGGGQGQGQGQGLVGQGGQNAGEVINEVNQVQERVREEQKKKADEKTKFFRQRLVMENNRRNMAMKKNIVAFSMKEGAGDFFKSAEVSELLAAVGFQLEDVEGIMVNCFRPTQVEVTFRREVEVKVSVINDKTSLAH